MVKLKQAIVVEGRYDASRLRQIVDAPIFETSGFGIMNDAALLALLRQVAERRGLIILTDSDGAGFVIRNFLRGALPPDRVLHAYIPDIYGKERRKDRPGKEGKLGVEAMEAEVILRSLERAGALPCEQGGAGEPITKFDLYRCGLSGTPESRRARSALLRAHDLPERMSTNAMLQTLNILYDRAEFLRQYAPDGENQ